MWVEHSYTECNYIFLKDICVKQKIHRGKYVAKYYTQRYSF